MFFPWFGTNSQTWKCSMESPQKKQKIREIATSSKYGVWDTTKECLDKKVASLLFSEWKHLSFIQYFQ